MTTYVLTLLHTKPLSHTLFKNRSKQQIRFWSLLIYLPVLVDVWSKSIRIQNSHIKSKIIHWALIYFIDTLSWIYRFSLMMFLSKIQGVIKFTCKKIQPQNPKPNFVILRIQKSVWNFRILGFAPSLNTASPAIGDLYVVHSDLRIWVFALKKRFFQLFQIFSKKKKKIIKAILCNFSMRLLKYF